MKYENTKETYSVETFLLHNKSALHKWLNLLESYISNFCRNNIHYCINGDGKSSSPDIEDEITVSIRINIGQPIKKKATTDERETKNQ